MRTLHLELGTHAEQTRMTRLRRIHRQTNQTKGHERSKRELASSALHNDLLLYYFQIKMGKKNRILCVSSLVTRNYQYSALGEEMGL